MTLQEIIDRAILDALERNNWNRTHAANELQLSRKGLRNNIDRLRLLGHPVPLPVPPKADTGPTLPRPPPMPHKGFCERCGRKCLSMLELGLTTCSRCQLIYGA